MAVTRKGYNLSGFSDPLDAKQNTPTPTPATKSVAQVSTPAPKPVTTLDAPTQAQKPVQTVTPITPTPTPAQPVTTPAKQQTPPKTDQYTQPAIQGKTKVGTPLDAGIKNTQTGQLDYQTPDEARLQQIQQNLTQYSQTSPEMFKDRASFDANFNYGTRSTEQKQVLDNFYKQYQLQQGNPDMVYQTLMSGGSIDPKFQNSAGFQQGYEKYQKIGMFSSMSAKQLAGQLGKKIIVGSSEWQELAKINPQLAQEALAEKNKLDAERSVNGTYTDLSGLESDRIPEIDVITESLAKLYDKLGSLNIDLAEEYRANVLENPVINDRYKAMEERSRKIAEMQSVRDRAIDEAYASAGGAPDSVIRARANMQYKALNNQIALMQADQEIDQAILSTDIERFTGMYNAKIDEYNQEVSMFQEQAKYVTDIADTVAGAYKDQRKTKLAEQQSQVQFERDMAMKQAEQEYQMTRDDQAYQRDVQLANIKYEQDLNQLQVKSSLDLQSSMTLAQQKAQLEGGGTVIGSQLVTQNPQAIVDFSVAQRDGRTNLQCGELVNDYVKKITGHTNGSPTWMGNLFTDKVNAINKIGASPVPVVGGVFAMPTNTKYGHTGIVQSVNGNTFTVLEANASGNVNGEEPKLSTYTINKSMKFSKEPVPKLSKDDSKVAGDAISQIKGKQIVKDYEKLYSKEKMLDSIIVKLKNGTQTSQDDQQLISDFAKVLDPDSVVRESEYELSSKYSMSKLNKMKQDAYNYLKTGGPLTKDAATVLAAGLRSRYDVYKQNAISEVDAVLAGTEYTLGYKLPAGALGLGWYNQSDIAPTTPPDPNAGSSLRNPNKTTNISQSSQDLVNSLF